MHFPFSCVFMNRFGRDLNPIRDGTRFTVCLTYSDISLTTPYVYKSMTNKRRITLPVVYSRPFASKSGFLSDFENIIRNSQQRTQTHSKAFKKPLLRQKDDYIPTLSTRVTRLSKRLYLPLKMSLSPIIRQKRLMKIRN